MHLHPDKNDGEGCHQFTELQQKYLQCLDLLEKEGKHATFSRRTHSHSHHPHCSSSSSPRGGEEDREREAREAGGSRGTGGSSSFSSHHFHHHHHRRGSAYERMSHMRGSPYPESFYTWKEGEGGGGKPGSYSFFYRFRSPFDRNHSMHSAPEFTSAHTHHAASWRHNSETRSRQETTEGYMGRREAGAWRQSAFTSDHDSSILDLSKNALVFLLGTGCLVTLLGLMSSSSSQRTHGKGRKEDEETFSLPHYLQGHSPTTPHRSSHRQGGEDELYMKERFFLYENAGEGQNPRARRGRDAQKTELLLETPSDSAEGIHGSYLSGEILKPAKETQGKTEGKKKTGEESRLIIQQRDGDELDKELHVVRLVPEDNHERRGELLKFEDFATPERLTMSAESNPPSEVGARGHSL